MKKINLFLAVIILFGISLPSYSFTKEDYKDIAKITKEVRKLSDKGKIEELADYFSDDYKSFDGYNKKEMIKIFLAAHRLYPNSKTKEKIKKFEEKENGIKIYIDETSKTIISKGEENILYANKKKIKGELKSRASYAMFYVKEGDEWKILGDEIFSETTEIRYGEALKSNFEMESPDKVIAGGEFTVKATLDVPKDRFVVGSIGHDKIIFPPEKYFDPYRAIPKSGILERVMSANSEGINEYANTTFAFISAPNEPKIEDAIKNASISGMGICVKRINILKNQPL